LIHREAQPAPTHRLTPSWPGLPARLAFFALDKLLGMFRQVVIARQFGVSAELDAFNAANNIPTCCSP